jgi:hypothetical protein
VKDTKSAIDRFRVELEEIGADPYFGEASNGGEDRGMRASRCHRHGIYD